MRKAKSRSYYHENGGKKGSYHKNGGKKSCPTTNALRPKLSSHLARVVYLFQLHTHTRPKPPPKSIIFIISHSTLVPLITILFHNILPASSPSQLYTPSSSLTIILPSSPPPIPPKNLKLHMLVLFFLYILLWWWLWWLLLMMLLISSPLHPILLQHTLWEQIFQFHTST